MRNLNNKAFFLAETIVVVGVVATILILFYSQIASFYANYERNSKYQTVEAIHAARNVQEYLTQYGSSATSLVDAITPIFNITTYNFDATGQYANLISKLGIKTVYISLYNINNVITNYASYGFNPTFVDFLRTQKVSDTKANTYRIIVLLNNGEYAHAYLTSEFAYAYTGDYQTFVAPQNGDYKIELWGASGSDVNTYLETIGHGAYTSGVINLASGSTLYIYVGSKGRNLVAGYNGGGNGDAAGGGATDIRLASGTWNTFDSLKSRIMVAAGGGGGIYSGVPYTGSGVGNAGGLVGYDIGISSNGWSANYGGNGGTQTGGGAAGILGNALWYTVIKPEMNGQFGQGGYYYDYLSNEGVYRSISSGGGGGYYGGGHGTHPANTWPGGGGGSSFISGYPGCNAISAASTASSIVHTNQPNHYSGYVFHNMQMIDGNSQMTNPAGVTETGHTGNGYARITYIGQ